MIFNLNNYLQQIVNHFSEFAEPGEHFARASSISNMEELIHKMSEVTGLVIISIDSAEGWIGDNQTDVFKDQPHHRFYIMKKTNIAGNTDERASALAQIKTLANKILFKMIKDRDANKNGLRFVDLGRIPYITVGPYLDGWIGVEYFLNTIHQILKPIPILLPDEDF